MPMWHLVGETPSRCVSPPLFCVVLTAERRQEQFHERRGRNTVVMDQRCGFTPREPHNSTDSWSNQPECFSVWWDTAGLRNVHFLSCKSDNHHSESLGQHIIFSDTWTQCPWHNVHKTQWVKIPVVSWFFHRFTEIQIKNVQGMFYGNW